MLMNINHLEVGATSPRKDPCNKNCQIDEDAVPVTAELFATLHAADGENDVPARERASSFHIIRSHENSFAASEPSLNPDYPVCQAVEVQSQALSDDAISVRRND